MRGWGGLKRRGRVLRVVAGRGGIVEVYNKLLQVQQEVSYPMFYDLLISLENLTDIWRKAQGA